MIGEGIHEEVLRALVEQHAVRGYLVATVGGSGARWGRCAHGVSDCALGPA
ncbi:MULTISPECIES: hypothetical protein [Pseudomonas]|uniref:hypothetical protein n=1 Tax=Pseudomonas siliginis TaxID=2842346 RepID=UPI001CEDAA41|nr:hypothetical protein [Pseudomonas siliginis]